MMFGYAVVRKDGSFVEGELPANIDRERFCIMCAASYGAATTAQKEIEGDALEVLIKSRAYSIIIRALKSGDLLVVIGDEEDMENLKRKYDAL